MHRLLPRLGLLAALCLGGCGGARDKPIGEACAQADECEHGICVAGIAGDDAVCTRSCASSEECPRGWSCSAVTAGNVLVCQRGAGNPFGMGTRE